MKPTDQDRPGLFRLGMISPVNRAISLAGVVVVLAALVFIDSDFVIGGSGRLELARTAPVFAGRGGVVEEVRFREGDRVKAGQVVVRLRDADRRSLLFSLEQRLAEAEIAVRRAELDLRRWEIRPDDAAVLVAPERLEWLEELLEARREVVDLLEEALSENLITTLQVRREQLGLLEAEGVRFEEGLRKEWLESGLLELSRERLEAIARHARRHRELLGKEIRWLEEDLARGELVAPFDGRISSLDYKYPGMEVPGGGFVFEVADDSGPFEVEALVGERNFDLLRVGGEVRMKSNVAGTLFGGEFVGVIAGIPLAPAEDGEGGPLYEVEIEVTEARGPLVHGSTVEVEFVLGRRTIIDAMIDGLAGRNARRRLTDESSAAPDQEAAQ
ncbi:MAG: efflux RND transporter periplasmic adaptor subunit [Puniceicoccaceae bacterium]